MAKNKLSDLNNHLFAQLERLSDEDLTTEEITKEAQRAEAVVKVGDQILSCAKITLDAMKLVANGTYEVPELNRILGIDK